MATTAAVIQRFKLVFFVPITHLEACKKAIFAAGAGHYPNYSECCFITIGTGSFRPADTANPHIGTPGTVEEVQEARLETVCNGEEVTRKAVEALKKLVIYLIKPAPLFVLLQTLTG